MYLTNFTIPGEVPYISFYFVQTFVFCNFNSFVFCKFNLSVYFVFFTLF